MLLLPGLLCDASVFAHQITALQPVAQVHVADFSQADSIRAMAEIALGLSDGPINLVGYSMGGRAALEACRIAPERVERLCLMDTGVVPAREGEAELRKPVLEMSEKQGMAVLAAAWLPPMLHIDRETDPALVGPLTEMVMRFTPAQHHKQIHALVGRPDARPQLPLIRCPTMVMVGRQDRWSPLAQHEEIAAAIPGAVLRVIEDSGHFTPVEQPEQVSAALLDWLAMPLERGPA